MGSNWMIINKQQSVGALFFLCKHFKSKHIRCIKEVEGASRSEKCLKHTFFPAGGGRLYKSLSVKFLGFMTWLPKASLRWPATAPVWSQVSTSQWTTSWYNHPFISYSMATTLPRHLTQTPQGASSTETVGIQQCCRYRGDLSIKIEPQQCLYEDVQHSQAKTGIAINVTLILSQMRPSLSSGSHPLNQIRSLLAQNTTAKMPNSMRQNNRPQAKGWHHRFVYTVYAWARWERMEGGKKTYYNCTM